MGEKLKIAVTGGSGNVGRFVVRHLLDRGHEVINLDRKRGDDDRARFVYCDVRNREPVSQAMAGCQAVCHLAEIPTSRVSLSADEIYWSNTRSASVVLQTAADLRMKHVIYTSTVQVYGVWNEDAAIPARLPIDETDPVQPLNPYAVSKVANETFARYVSVQHNLPISIFRFPGVLLEEPSDRALDSIERFEGLMEGMGTYIFAPDLARGYAMALEKNLPGCEVYNFCAADVRLNAPIQALLRNFKPEYPLLPEGWPGNKSPLSCEKATAKLGWTPQWSIGEFRKQRRGQSLQTA